MMSKLCCAEMTLSPDDNQRQDCHCGQRLGNGLLAGILFNPAGKHVLTMGAGIWN